MVTLEQLSALDLLIWTRTTERAARLAYTNQSTISRRSRAVLADFNLNLQRSAQGWLTGGDLELLRLERHVHQRARFRGRAPLRLHAPYWSSRQWSDPLPGGWLVNPPEPELVCENPVDLLRERIIDAALVTPTQLPAAVDDLQMLELVHRPIELTLFASGSDRHCRNVFARSLEQGALQLRLLPFLPHSCRRRSKQWFVSLASVAASDAGVCRSAAAAEG